MTSRIHRVMTLLMIFFGLSGLVLLSENAALFGREIRFFPVLVPYHDISQELTIEGPTVLTVQLPMDAIEEFITRGLTTWIGLSNFSLIAVDQPMQIEFHGGNLVIQFTLPDTHAQIMGGRAGVYRSEFDEQIHMGDTITVTVVESPQLFIAQGIQLVGDYAISVFDPLTGSSIGIRDAKLPIRGEITVEVLREGIRSILSISADELLQPGTHSLEEASK